MTPEKADRKTRLRLFCFFSFFCCFFLYCFTVTRSKKKYRRKKNRKLKTEGQSAIQTDSLSTIKNKLIRNGVHEVIENT